MQIKDEALDLAETRFVFFQTFLKVLLKKCRGKLPELPLSTSRRVIAALCNTCNVVLAFASG